MTDLPKFNFKAVDLDDAKLEELIAEGAPQESSKLRPGKHATTIVSSKYMGQSTGDTTWAKWVVTFEGAGGKEASDMIFVPSSKLTYLTAKGKEDTFAISKLKGFIEALGGEFKVATLGSTLAVYFGKEDALKGQNVDVVIGFAGTHLQYLGGNGAEKRYGLVYKSGDPVKDAPEFPDYDSAEKYCNEKGINYKSFPDVLKYERSAVGNKAANSNW